MTSTVTTVPCNNVSAISHTTGTLWIMNFNSRLSPKLVIIDLGGIHVNASTYGCNMKGSSLIGGGGGTYLVQTWDIIQIFRWLLLDKERIQKYGSQTVLLYYC